MELSHLPPETHPMDAADQAELELLAQIRDGVRSNTPSLALTDESVPPILNADYPVQGSSRWVVPRKAVGGRVALPSLVVPEVVLVANSNRSAGTIVNMGQADCLLILARIEEADGPGLGQIFLTAHGGSWDMRLGPPLWCGSVSGIALKTEVGEEVIEATELAVVEV